MENKAQIATSRPKLAWRGMTAVLIATAFIMLVLSGVILFISPPGRVANWTNWSILGLRKHDWTGLHVWFSLLFLLGALAHVFFNWRPLQNYFRDRMSRKLGFRTEWIAALTLCLLVFAGTRAGVVPFSSLLSFNERVKQSWETPVERAPVPHAELLTLAELAEKAGVGIEVASERLKNAGVTGFAPEARVHVVADANKRSAREIYGVLTGTPLAPAGSDTVNQQQHQPYGGGQGKGGGGPGRKTLAEYCAEQRVPLSDALTRLQDKGVKASAEITLREIAVNNGYSRPYEILDIINGK